MNKIGESELILTPDGRVYHINLRPDELADTVITVGDPDRVKEVSNILIALNIKHSIANLWRTLDLLAKKD